MLRRVRAIALVVCGALCALSASAQIEVGAGATIDIGGGAIDAGCQDLAIAGNLLVSEGMVSGLRSLNIDAGGQLALGDGTLSWSGDWTNNGQFDEGTSSASSVDGCGSTTSTFNTGDTFHSLSLQSTEGREIRFTSGQTTTVDASFAATGVSNDRLLIRSTTPGSAATLALGPAATQSVFAVDVSDNHASPRPIGQAPASNYASIKGTNSNGWFEDLLNAIPALSPLGLALVAAALGLAALWRLWGQTV